MPDPVVFISSTVDDLKEHREQAAKAAMASGFSVRMMECFPASGDKPSLEASREKVDEAEVVVAIVAHRYGRVPATRTTRALRGSSALYAGLPPGKDHARAAGIIASSGSDLKFWHLSFQDWWTQPVRRATPDRWQPRCGKSTLPATLCSGLTCCDDREIRRSSNRQVFHSSPPLVRRGRPGD